MHVRSATAADAADWLRLRCALWPEGPAVEHRDEIARYFAGTLREPLEVLLAHDAAGAVVGFAELSIRSYAEDCVTDRVAYLEGWYVVPEARRRGVGRVLVAAAERWARAQGCSEFASDALIDNAVSALAHRALGFVETVQIRCFRKALIAAALLLAVAPAHAQTVNIWPGIAPGSEQWTHQERTFENTPIGTVVQNVVTPTLTAYLPERAKATGTGVIIAPGGAFVALALSKEGSDVARWLQQRGIAAFVLKYRIVEKRGDGIPSMDMDTAGRYGIADGIQALAVVRQHADEWGVAPDRIGFLGFSAGAMVASGTVLQPDSAARPAFAGLIYGGPLGVMPPIPTRLPPLFLAWAQDDPLVLRLVERLRDTLTAAGHKPEVHVFASGGHGFGMQPQGTSSDHWIDAFYFWLEANGWTRPPS